MANPLDVACADGVWTKVATNITTGEIEVVKDIYSYQITFRLTAGGAPTVKSEGTRLKEWAHARHSAGVDVYVWCTGGAGVVRVYV